MTVSDGDWLAQLPPEDQEVFAEFVEHTRRNTLKAMTESAFVMSLLPTGTVDIKFAVELGLAIMLDKPILAVAMPGVTVPPMLEKVAFEVVKCDIDTEEGRAVLHDAISRLVKATKDDE